MLWLELYELGLVLLLIFLGIVFIFDMVGNLIKT